MTSSIGPSEALQAIFVASLTPVLVMYSVTTIGCLYFGIRLFFSSSSVFLGSVSLLLAATLSGAGIIRNWIQSVRIARFYENQFQLDGRGLSQDFSYSDIGDVSLEKDLTFYLPTPRIRIRTKESGDFVVFGNPKNRKLQTDLYSWLRTKVGAGAPKS